MRIDGIILAAGQSSRMGEAKLLLPWGGTTVLGRSLVHARQSKLHTLTVVTGGWADGVRPIAAQQQLSTIHNPAYAEGEMLSSLQVGLRALSAEADAVCVLLGDMPLIAPATIDALIDVWCSADARIVAPVFDGRRGHPVIFGREMHEALLALPLGASPRDVIRPHRDRLLLHPVTDEAVLIDLDTRERYEAALAKWGGALSTQ